MSPFVTRAFRSIEQAAVKLEEAGLSWDPEIGLSHHQGLWELLGATVVIVNSVLVI